MAQIGGCRLFEAGVAEVQRWFHHGFSMCRREIDGKCNIVVNLQRLHLRNLGLWWGSSVVCNLRWKRKDIAVNLRCILAEFVADESGATAIEYGLIAAGIALAIIETIYALGTNLVAKLQSLATAYPS